MADLSLVFDLLARDRASDEVKKVGDAFDRTGDKAGLFGKATSVAMAGAAAAAVGLVGLGAAAANFVSEAAESAKISRLTEAAVASTGGAAKISADQIGELAEALSNKTAIDDEAIQSASNLLLTFTNIRNEAGAGNDIFNQATEAALNMSTAMGTDANAAAMQLGKALNDPIKGVAALGKAGVQFTKEQKEQIATMVESGNVLGAQRMILGELSTQFGGAAAAAADPMERLRVITGNLGERIGTALLPYVERFSTWLVDKGVPFVERLIEKMETSLPPAIDAVTSAFTTVRDYVENDVIPTFEKMKKWFDDNRTAIEGVATAIAVVMLPSLLRMGVTALVSGVMSVAGWAMQTASAVAAGVVYVVQSWLIIGRWVLMGLTAVAQGAIIAAVWTAQIIASAVSGAASFALQVARVVGGWVLMGLTAVVQGAVQAAVWVAQVVAAAVSGAASFAVQVARVVAGWVLMGVQSMIQAARMAAAWFIALGPVGWVIGAIVGLAILIIANWDKIKEWTSRAWSAVTGFVSDAWERVKTAVSNGVTNAVNFVRDLPGKITSALGNLGSLLWNAGKDLLDGFLRGITSMWNTVKSKLTDLTDMLPDWKGPADRDRTVLFDSGRLVMQGFEDGLTSKFGDVQNTLGAFTGGLVAGADVDVTGGATGRGIGYTPPRYDLPAAGAAAAAPAVRTVNVSGVVGPETVAALVAREQRTDEFLAGAGAW